MQSALPAHRKRDGSSGLYIDMTQDDLSDLLGISRIHVTRGLSQLREQEIILTRRKQIEIRDSACTNGILFAGNSLNRPDCI